MEGLDRSHPESTVQQEFHEAQESGTSSLDPEIWTQLPFECLCCILERVPADSLIRWRRVSKTWIQRFFGEVMYGSPPWMPRVGETVPLYNAHLGSLAPTGTSELIAFTMKTFNRSRNTWEPLPLIMEASHPRVLIFYDSVLFTSGGIILLDFWFRNLQIQVESSLTVFNPTSSQRRQLPPCPDPYARPFGVVSTSDGRFYAVVATRWVTEMAASPLFVYKSESGSWHDSGALPRAMRPSPFQSTASVGNVLYFIGQTRFSSELLQKQRLCAFDLASGTCQALGKVPRHFGSGTPSLVANGDHLLYVAPTASMSFTYGGLHRTWRIYKYDTATRRWTLETTMPAQIYEQLIQRIDHRSLHVSGAGNYVYFYGAPPPTFEPSRVPAHTFGLPLVLAHNISERTWDWLPDVATGDGEIPIFQGYPIVFAVEPSFMPV